MTIQTATQEDLDDFFTYLERHLSENGKDRSTLFQPLSQEKSTVNDAMKARFFTGVAIPVGEPQWRHLWLSRDAAGSINGHIDLRSHPEPHTEHRVLLGMGVSRFARRQGIGTSLLLAATEFCEKNPNIEWLDLRVVSSNNAAVALYQSNGFVTQGEFVDMFRIDGKRYSYTAMSKPIRLETD